MKLFSWWIFFIFNLQDAKYENWETFRTCKIGVQYLSILSTERVKTTLQVIVSAVSLEYIYISFFIDEFGFEWSNIRQIFDFCVQMVDRLGFLSTDIQSASSRGILRFDLLHCHWPQTFCIQTWICQIGSCGNGSRRYLRHLRKDGRARTLHSGC